MSEKHLRGILNSASSCIDKLLQEYLAKDAVCLFAEDGAEDDGDAVVGRFDVDGFFVAVVHGAKRAAAAHAFGRGLGGVFCGFGVQGFVFGEGGFKGGGHGVAAEEGDAADEIGAGVWVSYRCQHDLHDRRS